MTDRINSMFTTSPTPFRASRSTDRLADALTQPFPAYLREPLLILIDANNERRVWVVRLLTLAYYHVYDTESPLEAFTWWVQHPSIPQALLLGYVSPSNQFFVQRLRQQVEQLSRKALPMIVLTPYLPDSAFASLRRAPTDSRGPLALLDILWRTIPRLSSRR